MAATCKYNQYGHCRYGRFYNFQHVNQKCDKDNCNSKMCILRHPKKCRNILQNKTCPFGNVCDFDHGHDSSNNDSKEHLEVKIIKLEELLIAEIQQLLQKQNEDNESFSNEPPVLHYKCEQCKFEARSSAGLKVHIGKKHKIK